MGGRKGLDPLREVDVKESMRTETPLGPSRSLVLLVNLLVLVPKLQRLRFWLEAEAWKGVKQCYWDGNREVLET